MNKCENCGCLNNKKLYEVEYKGDSFYGSKPLLLIVERCAKCSLIRLHHEGGSSDVEDMHDDWWEVSWKDTYIRFKKKIDLNNVSKLEFLAERSSGKRLLDIGCGCGYFLDVARDMGWAASGSDISSAAVKHAKDVLGLDVFCGKINDAEYPDNIFDVVTMWDVIEHVDHPRAIINEINRILKPGGLLVIETPNANSLIHRIAHIIYRMSFGKISYFLEKIYIPSHLYYFSKMTMGSMLQNSGFSIEKSKVPFKSLFDDLDIIFSANKDREKWAGSLVFKIFASLGLWISSKLNSGYRLLVMARKNDE